MPACSLAWIRRTVDRTTTADTTASWYDDRPATNGRGRDGSVRCYRKTVWDEVGDEAVGLDVCFKAEGMGTSFKELKVGLT